MRNSGSQKVRTHKCESDSLNIDGIPEKSSDLEREAAPRSIAGEFSGIPSLFQKVNRGVKMYVFTFKLHLSGSGVEACSTIAWSPVSFWTVNVSGADRPKAHGSSDVCSELTQATQAQKATQADNFTRASA
jgi:hypothetical protein